MAYFLDFGESEKEIAELLGYKKTSFSQIMNGKVPISDKFIDKLLSLDKNINKVWIKTGQGSMLKEPISNNIFYGDNQGVNGNNTGSITNNYGNQEEETNNINNKYIAVLEAQLKDKEKILVMQEEKISDLERRLELAELKSKEAMSAKIEMQRVRLQAKKALISEKDEIIFAQNEEINAMKSVNTASNDVQQIQPSKGV